MRATLLLLGLAVLVLLPMDVQAACGGPPPYQCGVPVPVVPWSECAGEWAGGVCEAAENEVFWIVLGNCPATCG